jgi:ribosomal protein L18E
MVRQGNDAYVVHGIIVPMQVLVKFIVEHKRSGAELPSLLFGELTEETWEQCKQYMTLDSLKPLDATDMRAMLDMDIARGLSESANTVPHDVSETMGFKEETVMVVGHVLGRTSSINPLTSAAATTIPDIFSELGVAKTYVFHYGCECCT